MLEAARRAVGLVMTLIGAIFIPAGLRGELPFLADWMPSILNHRGYSIGWRASSPSAPGIFASARGSPRLIFVFAARRPPRSHRCRQFFIDLAYAATGRQGGGPAMAVLASAGMGSISGSAISVTTGAFTIPLMKRLGYRPAQAGGQAAASTGGRSCR